MKPFDFDICIISILHLQPEARFNLPDPTIEAEPVEDEPIKAEPEEPAVSEFYWLVLL